MLFLEIIFEGKAQISYSASAVEAKHSRRKRKE
jgi:hypothetical protein